MAESKAKQNLPLQHCFSTVHSTPLLVAALSLETVFYRWQLNRLAQLHSVIYLVASLHTTLHVRYGCSKAFTAFEHLTKRLIRQLNYILLYSVFLIDSLSNHYKQHTNIIHIHHLYFHFCFFFSVNPCPTTICQKIQVIWLLVWYEPPVSSILGQSLHLLSVYYIVLP